MKLLKHHLTIALTLLLSLNAIGQLQRLSILPKSGIKITNTEPENLNTISIDYYREAPNSLNTINQPRYDQVYSSGDVIVKIDGVQTSRNFQSLVQSENPLLLFKPISHEKGTIFINPNNPESEKIESIEIEFKTPSEIGNLKDDRDVLQSQIIFKNWGNDISQEDFWNRAKCLDILKQNNKLTYQKENQITESSKQLCDKLFNKIDFNMFSHMTFKSLVSNNCFVLDENLNFTNESIQTLQQCFYYEQSIMQTKVLNKYWNEYEKMITNSSDYFDKELAYKAKLHFYQVSKNLTSIDKENKEIRDTMINGFRYVLMVAWKSNNFMDYANKTGSGMPTYKSNADLFKYPLFLTPKADIEKWTNNNGLKSLTETQYKTRLMQLLGLPPKSTNNTFIEFWASEQDVFRPSIDSTLKSSLLLLKLSAEYIKSFSKFSNGSFDNENFLKQYPFTGLGYTWDYNPDNRNHIGVTEFVLKENRTVYIRQTVPTKDYIDNLTGKTNK